ncbi:hypothetical protein PQI66_11900 [Corynebacterium sp. USCH3]|uniref:hypothetical protein n=1 Tax=Corynebacterium sp. USCH3 TaxID=3024840 RepID=UPI0030B1A77D
MNRHRAAVTAALAAVLSLGALSACSDDDGTTEPSFTESTSAAADTVTETVTTEAAEPSATSEPEVPEGHLAVSASGSGPIALTTDDAPDGETENISGRLVTGQGSCFAVVGFNDDGAPRPLVIPADSDIVTQGGRPAVTLPGQDAVHVGETIDVEAVTVPITDLEGVPEQCTRGDAEDALVVG